MYNAHKKLRNEIKLQQKDKIIEEFSFLDRKVTNKNQ